MIDLSIYKNKKIFITGHTGFCGTWLYTWLKLLGADVYGYSLHNENSDIFKRMYGYLNETNSNKNSIKDVRNKTLLYCDISLFNPDLIIHLAAQPLVFDSYSFPFDTFSTNIQGTLNLLEVSKYIPNLKGILNITTDKVYLVSDNNPSHKEEDLLGGYDPYAVSKVCSELITTCYKNNFLKEKNICVSTCRSGNIIGGGDFSKNRIIPDIMQSLYNNKELTIRNPEAIRPFTYILDTLYGYLSLGYNMLNGIKIDNDDSWNFSSNDVVSVKDILTICGCLYNIVSDDRKETKTLLLNSSKANKYLNWCPLYSIEESLIAIDKWYKEYYLNNNIITVAQIKQYMEKLKYV